MRVLAIDTALEACSAAVLDTARGGIVARESIPMVRGHAEALVPLIAKVAAQAGVEFASLDRLAVTCGPGSFTGLRVGIAAARGIALAAGKPAYGITTLAAFAAPHIAGRQDSPIAVAIDARHRHVYLQVFDAGGSTLVAPRIAALADAVRLAADAGAGVRLVGNAAALMLEAWTEEPPSAARTPGLADQRAFPDIDWVARLGAAAAGAASAPKPLYLRAPDAQPQAAARLPRR